MHQDMDEGLTNFLVLLWQRLDRLEKDGGQTSGLQKLFEELLPQIKPEWKEHPVVAALFMDARNVGAAVDFDPSDIVRNADSDSEILKKFGIKSD